MKERDRKKQKQVHLEPLSGGAWALSYRGRQGVRKGKREGESPPPNEQGEKKITVGGTLSRAPGWWWQGGESQVEGEGESEQGDDMVTCWGRRGRR